MIDPKALLKDLQPLVTKLEDDLRTRISGDSALSSLLQADYDAARKANRTAQTLAAFTDEHVTQIAVAWILATVFVRFVEDNELCGEPWLSGPGKRLAQARDRYVQWLPHHKSLTEREYLLHVFTELGKLPGLAPLLGPKNTLLHRIGPSADKASELRAFWQQVDGTGDKSHLRHDFTDPAADTRFLGDLYQDLSESAQKKFALLQTPDFIEEFILDRTLEPAIAEFGLAEVRLIDPACGSGHFLLGAFTRLFDRWTKQEPGTPVQVRARRALESVAGVDLNPFAVAIARFRLLVAVLQACNVRRLMEAYDFRPPVASGDSLLHSRVGQLQLDLQMQETQHFYSSEDPELLKAVFGRTYHVVVGNPPYIEPSDGAIRDLHRKKFGAVCHGRYHLDVPFAQVFFDLGRDERRGPAHVGYITSNAFMKREFGAKLIESYLAHRTDITHIIDLSGAYIPGHGTPTVILLGRPRSSTSETVRAVLGIRGEPATPANPSKGLVWSAVIGQIDRPGSESFYVSSDDVPRERYKQHPWCIAGGGACDLKESLEERFPARLGSVADSIGITSFTLEDDLFLLPPEAARLHRLPANHLRQMLVGDEIRDWSASPKQVAVFPYDGDYKPIAIEDQPDLHRYMWLGRATIAQNKMFGSETKVESGLQWFEFGRLTVNKLRTPLSITFAEVATHNHFVLDRGGKVFKQTAPVIKLPAGATEDEHLGLLGLLNSSTACFWLKQVCHNKGSTVDQHGARQRTAPFEDFYQLSGTRVQEFPVADARPLVRARRLAILGNDLGTLLTQTDLRSTSGIAAATERHRSHLAEAMAIQEELDWECYRHYGLTKEDLTFAGKDLPALELGQRAFEIVLARQLAAGKSTTTWFERHGSTPITEIPAHWPRPYRDLVQRRIDCIEKNADIRLIEQPEFKRRWNVEPFAEQLQRAQRSWLLDRMEDPKFWPEPQLLSTARFAEKLRLDPDFLQVANVYRGRDDYDFDDLVRELVESEAVPFLPVLRYKPSGLRKRADWEATWALQRREDAGEKVGPIPVPPKYVGADFLKSSYWSLRGKLDVPKERFVFYPTAERSDDPTPVFTWAGFDHAQQARALAERYLERKEQDAATPDQLVPLLAGLRELIPWLLQWHNEPTDATEAGFGTAYQDFVATELRALGKSVGDLLAWTPPARSRGRGARAAGRARRPATSTDDES
jgi:hypothetical protein